jgi:hypothetical protein
MSILEKPLIAKSIRKLFSPEILIIRNPESNEEIEIPLEKMFWNPQGDNPYEGWFVVQLSNGKRCDVMEKQETIPQISMMFEQVSWTWISCPHYT